MLPDAIRDVKVRPITGCRLDGRVLRESKESTMTSGREPTVIPSQSFTPSTLGLALKAHGILAWSHVFADCVDDYERRRERLR